MLEQPSKKITFFPAEFFQLKFGELHAFRVHAVAGGHWSVPNIDSDSRSKKYIPRSV